MSDATKFSKLGYIILKKETTAGTAVYPDTPIELLSESIVMNWSHTPSNTIAGNRSNNLRPILNRIEPAAGTIELLAEPKQLGHLLTGLFGEATDSTLEASTVFLHEFEPQTTLKTYTMDVKPADENYVFRYFGVRVQSVEFTIEDNKIKVSLGVMAQKAFTNARVTLAASSGTSLKVDQTAGLTTSDTIIVIDATDPTTEIAEYTISAVVDENTLTVSTISASLGVDDIVVIKKQTPTYNLSNELIWSGGADVEIATGAHGVQNLSAKTNTEKMTVRFENELEPRWAATGVDVVDRMPANILVKGFMASGDFSEFHVSPELLDMLRKDEQATLRFNFVGVALSSNAAAAASANVETDGTDQLSVTIDATGEAGNDYAIIFTTGNASLTASLSGKLITVNLDAVGANNTTTLVAAAINGLSGVSCATTGTDLVDTASNASKIHFAGGRDASEKEKLSIELPNVRFEPFNPNISSDGLIEENVPFTAFRDSNDGRDVRVVLRNGISDY